MAEIRRLVSLPPRPDDGNKGSFGTVTVVGGSENYLGAPILCGKAAYRAGCGLVEMVVPDVVRNCCAGSFPEAIWNCRAFAEGTVPVRKNGVTVIGPGLGTAPETAEKLPAFIREAASFSRFLVLDADALNLLAKDPLWYEKIPKNCVLTPHPGEMARLTGLSAEDVQRDRVQLAHFMAMEWQQIVLLKGAKTVIAAPEGYYVVMPYATSALSMAGSGDVLSGIIAGFGAQGKFPFDAAWLGGEIHARAGLISGEKYGSTYPVMAGDLLEGIPEAIADYPK